MEIEIGIGKSGRRAYGFDDIAIVPSRRTRDPEDVDISWEIDAFKFELPLVASAMDGVVSPATAAEIDRIGIVSALGLAASRALSSLGIAPDVLIIDGNTPFLVEEPAGPRIMMRIKADQDCASVAAASVIAKVERDTLMTRLHADHPEYGWDGNKGYGAAVHTDAIRTHGVTQYHRTSWNLGV